MITFRPAARSSSIPLIGIFGESGTGKTMSALLLARGFVGPKGRIVMIDTESGRGALYADVIPGGYSHGVLGEPFTSDRYIEAIREAEKNADLIIIDSASHEWEGIGGVLDQAAAIEERTGKAGLHCWNKPKAAHTKFMLKLLGLRKPVIVCLRAKFKSRQLPDPKKPGKTMILRDAHASPIQDDAFIFEMLVHFETLKATTDGKPDRHHIRLTKCSHPDLVPCFPSGSPITVEHGKAMAQWAKAEKPADAPDKPAQADDGPVAQYTNDHANALAAADERGRDAFMAEWRKVPKADRSLFTDHMKEWERAAKAADAAKADTGTQPPEGD